MVVVKVGPTISCVPGVSGFSRVTHPSATNWPCLPASTPSTLFGGSVIGWRDVNTSDSKTLRPSTVTDVTLVVAALALRRRSGPQGGIFSSKVLHSWDQPTTKIRVPGFTVHDLTSEGPNGATIFLPRSQQGFASGLPKGF